MAANKYRRKQTPWAAGVVAFAIVFGCFLVRYEILERRFRQIYPDDSEAQLLEVVGAPTSIRGCSEGIYRLPTEGGAGTTRCARVYWYSAYIITDGWLVPIDDTGHVMQIRRLALP